MTRSDMSLNMAFEKHVTLLLFVVQIGLCTDSLFWDYIVVGCGPSGLQMGYYLQQANRNYVILERSNTSASFFLTYPRHDRLISINKRHTGKTNKEFNLRHDWNSLLSADQRMLFRHFSRQFFPHRRELGEYMNAFKERWSLNVRYGVDIVDVSKVDDTFVLTDKDGSRYRARRVLMATGMWKPNKPPITGLEIAEGYESMSTDPEVYQGKTVLILGHGNAAFETADSIYGKANLVHVVGRSRVRLSWETHYVGDIRGVNNGLLDSYQLKSLDGVVEGSLSDIYFERRGEQIYVGLKNITSNDNFALRKKYDVVIRCLGFNFDTDIFNSSLRVQVIKEKFPLINTDYQVAGVRDLYVLGSASHSLDYRRSAGGFIHGFRYTVRALHRLMEYRYEGVPWPSTLYQINHILPHLVKRINEASGIYQMYSVLGDVVLLSNGTQFRYVEEFPLALLPRFTEITGLSLGQHIVVLLEYGHNYSGPGKDVFKESRATSFAHRAHRSNFLHPVLYYYDKPITDEEYRARPSDWTLPKPRRLHHVVEDFLTDWSRETTHVLPLRRFLESCVGFSLRTYFHDDCFKMQLLYRTTPVKCRDYTNDVGLDRRSASVLTTSRVLS